MQGAHAVEIISWLILSLNNYDGSVYLNKRKIANFSGSGGFYSVSSLTANKDEIIDMFVLLFSRSSIYLLQEKKNKVA